MDEKAEEELQNQLEFLDTDNVDKRNLKSRASRKVSFAPASSNEELDLKESKDEGFEDGEGMDIKEGEDGEMKLVAGLKKTDKKKKKKKFMLPWGFVFVGWGAGFITIGYAFYLTIQVAGGFGKEKATEWLQTMGCSLIQDILFSQPIKVLCLATFYALVIKKPDKEDENPGTPLLKGDEEYIHERLTEEELKDPDKLEALEQQKMMCPVKPPDLDDIAEARDIRFKEMKMNSVLKEIWLYMTFLLILFMMGYGNVNPDSYYIQHSVRSVFLNADYNGGTSFGSINTIPNFWSHVRGTFVPSLYTPDFDNGEPDLVNGRQKYIADKSHILLGTARLRQLRVYDDSCKLQPVMEETIHHCRDEYSAADDVEISYDIGWEEYNRTIGIEHDRDPYLKPWKYRYWDDTDSDPQYVKITVYYGGRFVVEFGNNLEADLEMLQFLEENMWVDQQTRAVFFEFAVYNPVSNVHIFAMNLVEFLTVGGSVPFVSIRCMVLDHYYGVFAYFVMAAEAAFCLFLLWFLFKEARNLKREKKQYFKSLGNWFEMITLGLAIGGVVGYFYKLFVSMRLMEALNETPNEFHSFQYLAYWDDIYMSMVGVLVFLATIKFSKLLRFNKKMLLLSHTISNFATELSMFMVMFGVVYMAFGSFCFLNFYIMYEYSNFLLTLESLFGTLLGKFDFKALVQADRVLGPMFFFFYVLLVMWTLVNMFVAIICDGFARAREAQAQMENELEIVDFMMDRFKQYTGTGEKRIKAEVKVHKYIEGVEDVQRDCDEMKHKLDDMVGRLNDFIVNTKRADKELFGDPDEAMGKPRVIYTG
ncbi:polycystin-2-like protein 2 [Amphiura filiformis]|uniref:polycystin-2-like protein 2 n=1 Tax=Amphiura filiformis TaxID=82378 RepID=UPI003B2241F9